MRKLVISATTALAAAGTALLPSAPAHAAGAIVCTLHYASTTGTSQGSGVCGTSQMTFTAQNNCPDQSVQGVINGGPGITQFWWTRKGAAGVIQTVHGAVGTIAFSSTCPTDGETAVISLAP